MDLAVGTGCLLVEEGDAVSPLKFNAVPLPRLTLNSGPDNKIDQIFRTRYVDYEDLQTTYPKSLIPVDLLQKTQNSRSKCQVVYGRGPVFNAMAAIKTTNLTVELILQNAQMAISGVYTFEDDGVVNPDNIQLVPGSLIPVSPGSRGLVPIQGAGNFDVAQLILQDMRQNIKKALWWLSVDFFLLTKFNDNFSKYLRSIIKIPYNFICFFKTWLVIFFLLSSNLPLGGESIVGTIV